MGKRIENVKKSMDLDKRYSVEDAVKLIKEKANAKFDETVELHIKLGIDPKKADQNVRGTIPLPHGTGKKIRVAVIAKGEKVNEAKEAGADLVGSTEIIDEISKGKIDFDVLVVTPDIMKDIAKLGKILGPKGLMPNPKSGTVTFSIGPAVKEIKAGRIEFKNDAYGIIHTGCGKKSFSDTDLVENIKAIIDSVIKAKPSTSKGKYIQSIYLSSTMGPGIPVKFEEEA
ncbi:MAG: 50S ribosomal protein L1 [Elusimicrobiales bacterium]|jgi:large subunit ribosomal protein L1|nr:50S ribosomal protein L1 [Elusimicrobiales bacterium]